jgi:AcrR family transcriptional regulator
MSREAAQHESKEVPVRRRLSGPQRRASLLDASVTVFARRGYEAARIDEIAAEADVSKALIYEHFPGKRELYAEIVRDGTEEALSRVSAAVNPGSVGGELLKATIVAFLDFVAERPDLWRVINQQVPDATIVALEESLHRKAVDLIATLVAADPFVRELGLPRAELEQVAEMINGATLNVVDWWLRHPEVKREVIASNLISFLWLGMDRTRRGQRYGAPSASADTIDSQ